MPFVGSVFQFWYHCDSGECPGKTIGTRVMLDNGLSGFIKNSLLSDSPVEYPEKRVQVRVSLIDKKKIRDQ